MPRARLITNKWWRLRLGNCDGFSVVEALLAAATFGILTTAVLGAVIFGRNTSLTTGNQTRAQLLADEGLEAVRNIRDAAYTNLADGTFGAVQSANQWTLSGSQDVSGIFTRAITISSSGTNRKTISVQVSWTEGGAAHQITASTRLANWRANVTVPVAWTNAQLESSLNLTGTHNGLKVATQSNYAYVARATGTPNFQIVDITNPASPTAVGSLTLTGVPTNVFVSGNYAYVTNSGNTSELQIINVSNPAAPVLTGTYNAAGNSDGLAVFVTGTTAYLARAANGTSDEVVAVNVTTPATPTRTAGFSSNINMNDIYFANNTVYVATSSDTQELLVLNSALALTGTSLNLTGTVDATSLTMNSGTLFIAQGTALRSISLATPTVPSLLGSLTLTGTINSLAAHSSLKFVFAGTSAVNNELQVIDATTLTAMTVVDTVSLTSNPLNGITYNSTKDRVIGVTSSDTQEVVIFDPN